MSKCWIFLDSNLNYLKSLAKLRGSIKEDITAQKIKFSIEDFLSKCDQIRRKLRIWSYLPKKSLMVTTQKTAFFVLCIVQFKIYFDFLLSTPRFPLIQMGNMRSQKIFILIMEPLENVHYSQVSIK